MYWLAQRFNFLFRSTKGLILVAIAMIALAAAFFGMLSGPMVEFGARDFVVRAFRMSLLPEQREGRIIILYHSIAMAVVAIQTYLITGMLEMKRRTQVAINSLITIGYLCAMIFGLAFAYFGHNWAFHGLYIAG
jgi:cation transport ATPase